MNSMTNETVKMGMVKLDKEDVSAMLTAEFIVKGVIPGNVRLEIKEWETDKEIIELVFQIHEDYIN